jgi:hypothetical protein
MNLKISNNVENTKKIKKITKENSESYTPNKTINTV